MIKEKEQVIRILKGPAFERNRHGSLYDRGSADNYYGRAPDPHWYPEGTGHGEKITNLTDEQIGEYMAGYIHNEKFGDKKNWD